MATISATGGNNSLNAISNAYVNPEEEKDPLGRDAFLTMLVAQLQHQDPLNPMDGTAFTAQLAQFSSLEAQFNTNETLEAIQEAINSGSASDHTDYIGKEIVGSVESIEVSGGVPFGGYFTLENQAEVMIAIYDQNGQEVRSIYPGQTSAGTHAVEWDGKDSSGKMVLDGTYTYDVFAKDDSGRYSKVQTTVSGIVGGIVYNNGVGYLQVGGALIHPDNVLQVMHSAEGLRSANPVEYMGKTIEAASTVLELKGGELAGSGFYNLDSETDVRIIIYDLNGNPMKSLDYGKQGSGDHTVEWNGSTDMGTAAPDGMYRYEVMTRQGQADKTVSGEVSGVIYKNGAAYLNVGDRLVEPSSVMKVGSNVGI